MNTVNFIHPKSENYGAAIRYFRAYAGMTQEELAEALGVTVVTISYWENYHQRPQKSKFRRLNDFLRKKEKNRGRCSKLSLLKRGTCYIPPVKKKM